MTVTGPNVGEGSNSSEDFAVLCGQKIFSVEFVCDYVRIHFDNAVMAFINPMSITGSVQAQEGAPGFRDAICSIIGKTVEEVRILADASMEIVLKGMTVSVSLRPEDYHGPEAATLHCNGRFYASI
jgi:hypothetical protein